MTEQEQFWPKILFLMNTWPNNYDPDELSEEQLMNTFENDLILDDWSKTSSSDTNCKSQKQVMDPRNQSKSIKVRNPMIILRV